MITQSTRVSLSSQKPFAKVTMASSINRNSDARVSPELAGSILNLMMNDQGRGCGICPNECPDVAWPFTTGLDR